MHMQKLLLKLSYLKLGRVFIHLLALIIFKETIIQTMAGIIREFKIL